MKFLAVLFSMALTFNVSAGLISTETDDTSYNTGETVTVDIFVNHLNPALNFLELDFGYDDTQLAFIDNSWLDSLAVFNFGAFADAFTFTSDTLILQAFFLNGITDAVGNSFKLGSLQFTALSDITAPLFSSTVVVAQDTNYSDVDTQAVSAPSTTVLLSLIAGLMLVRSRKQA